MTRSTNRKLEFDNLDIHIASRLIGADEFPIPDYQIQEKELLVEFDYPLHRPITVKYQSQNGFTLENLIDSVCRTYQEIYDEDKRTTKDQEAFDGGGTYGIWGHGRDELWIESITRREDGVIEPGMGSRPSPFWILGAFASRGPFSELDRDYFADFTPYRDAPGFSRRGEIFILACIGGIQASGPRCLC